VIAPRTLALLALALAGCGAGGPSAPVAPSNAGQAFAPAPPAYTFTDPDRKKKLASAFPALDAIAEEELRRQNLPGLAIGVVIDGELAYAKGFGVADQEKKTPPDLDTSFRIGSITKSFTALALLSLRDDGTLSLEDPLTRWLPEASALVYPTHDEAPITLRQLLTHTSGLPRDGSFDYGGTPSEGQITRSLSGFALQSPPGAVHRYSNLGFILLGLVAGRASRSSLREIVRARIFAPLGMTSASWDRGDLPAGRAATGYDKGTGKEGGVHPTKAEWNVGASGGAGGIYASVREMARYVAFQLDAYPPRNGPERWPIRRSTVREAHATGYRSGLSVGLASAPAKGESLVRVSAFNYGFGWVNEQTCAFDDLVWHNGSMPGFAADIRFLQDRGVGVIALTNLAGSEPGAFNVRALEALRKTGGLVKRAPALPPAFAPVMARFLAVYNTWDEAAYHAMLRAGRKDAPTERDELAGYRELHGACKGWAPIEVVSQIEARFAMECERGPFETRIILWPADGLVDGFVGTSRDLPVPPALRPVADDMAGLIRAWDDAVYEKHLAKFPKPRDEMVKFFDGLRASHGACTVTSSTMEAFDRTLVLTCDRGGALSLTLAVDPKAPDAITGIAFRNAGGGGGGGGPCPVR
jgi:CubicO group peptidase (beta-lactamase class C family)